LGRPYVLLTDGWKMTDGGGLHGNDGAMNMRYPTGFGCDCRVSSNGQSQLLKAIEDGFHLERRRQADGSK
jgi:hypothetical protein